MPHTKIPLSIAALLLFTGISCHADLPGHGDPVDFRLTILHSNDADSLLKDSTVVPGFGGASRFVTVVRQARAAAGGNSLLLSAGNHFFIGREFDVSLDRGFPYLDSKVLSAVKYDAACLGNHDFAYGNDVLSRFIRGVTPLRTQFLSANVQAKQSASFRRQHRIARSTILRKRGVKIGVIGVTVPIQGFTLISGELELKATIRKSVRTEVARLHRRGAKIVILLSNLDGLDEQRELVPELRGVDIVVAGGGFETLANRGDKLVPGDKAVGAYPLLLKDKDGREVPVVTTGGRYLYLGQLSVGFNKGGEVAAVYSKRSGPIRVAGRDAKDGAGPAQDVVKEVIEPLREGLDELGKDRAARIQSELNGIQAVVRTRETNLGDLVADAILHAAQKAAREPGLPRSSVALINGGAIADNSVLRGEITARSVYNILPFPDFVTVALDVDPDQFKELLENAVSQVDNRSGRFAQIAGFTFRYTTNGRPQKINDAGKVVQTGNRVIEVRLDNGRYIVRNGRVVKGAPTVHAATIDYLAIGGDQYPFRGFVSSIGVPYQHAFLDYIRELGVIRTADYPPGGLGRIIREN